MQCKNGVEAKPGADAHGLRHERQCREMWWLPREMFALISRSLQAQAEKAARQNQLIVIVSTLEHVVFLSNVVICRITSVHAFTSSPPPSGLLVTAISPGQVSGPILVLNGEGADSIGPVNNVVFLEQTAPSYAPEVSMLMMYVSFNQKRWKFTSRVLQHS